MEFGRGEAVVFWRRYLFGLKLGDALKFGALNDPALAAFGRSTTEPSTLCTKEDATTGQVKIYRETGEL